MTECLPSCPFRVYSKTPMEDMIAEEDMVNGITNNRYDQMFGVLWKKHGTSHQGGTSSKWGKRFFVIRDSFLLYYAENEQKDYEKNHQLNIHPKGILPLGNCDIKVHSIESGGRPFAFGINGVGLRFSLVLAADSEYDREKWLNALHQASRVTWSNAKLWDALIRQLEDQGLQMAREKQVYFDKLQIEAMALHDEKLRTEELERMNDELEKERTKMEKLTNELRDEYDKMKIELAETMEELKAIKETKEQLVKRMEKLQKTLEALECEKLTTLTKLKDRQTQEIPLEQPEQMELSLATQKLHCDLEQIELRMKALLRDKALAETQLRENQLKEQELEEEKKAINEHAEGLKESIKELAAQKAVTEVELKEEIYARLTAERRLQNAEQTLTRLETIIQTQGLDGRDIEDTKNDMMGDVKRLRSFFENLSTEAKIDSENSVMVKNTIHARKSIVKRAKTLRLETMKKQRLKSGRSGSHDGLESILGSTSEQTDQ